MKKIIALFLLALFLVFVAGCMIHIHPGRCPKHKHRGPKPKPTHIHIHK